MPDIERLQQLRRVVEAAPEERFDMRSYCDVSGVPGCGTAYCAAGWAAIDPWFRDRGLFDDLFDYRTTDEGAIELLTRVSGGATFQGLATIFGLSFDDAGALFGSGLNLFSARVPKERVLANIDRVRGGLDATYYTEIEVIEDLADDDELND